MSEYLLEEEIVETGEMQKSQEVEEVTVIENNQEITPERDYRF